MPLVATEDGGPRDIIGNCQNGYLIDPLESSTITEALLSLLQDKEHWQDLVDKGLKGVKQHYSWDAHVKSYLKIIMPIAHRSEYLIRQPVTRRSSHKNEYVVITDLDLNLIGDDEALQRLIILLRQNRKMVKFAVATGRRFDIALKLLKKHKIPEPDILITSAGTEIYYAPKLTPDTAWTKHIEHLWSPHTIRALLDDYPGLERQPKSEQSRFKLSYFIDPQVADIEEMKSMLHREEQSVHIQVAFGQYLDITPLRASKGMALRYVADRWQIPLEHVFVAGGSGADEDMMRGNTLAAVVANRHHEELSQLIDIEHIYFASKAHAEGILEALEHYDFFNKTKQS